MITTGAGSRWPSDHAIVDLPAAGPSHPSLVRWEAFTLPVPTPGRKFGSIGAADRNRVAEPLAVARG